MESSERNQRAVRIGTVVSNKMDKTVVVKINRRFPHPLYRRIVTRSAKFVAHDETNECRIGDTVKIMSTRPLSKTKRWRVEQIIEKAK